MHKLRELRQSILTMTPMEVAQVHRTIRESRKVYKPIQTRKKNKQPTVKKKKDLGIDNMTKLELKALLCDIEKRVGDLGIEGGQA